ncbi:AP-3 complex subunit beta [Metarhizium rileyi]|uniref:AP-3 complex subunit beta n=1 Tax=Metarhizium rileyi (strain RCEF 4871) TaxID=1649241 RepID=A0A5C6G9Z0_METRR|nr:AP-3 complex subunit beta [Metarhizium rileyi]
MESISRMSSFLGTARALTLDAAQATRNVHSSSPSYGPKKIEENLESGSDKEVLGALRQVISMMYRNQETLVFFKSVAKQVASTNPEIKKLVYIYLIHHAEERSEQALMSINTMLLSKSDPNPQMRALALRTLAGIRLDLINGPLLTAIKNGVTDMSPYVRKAAALSIPKRYRLDPSQLPELIDYLATLIGDKQYYVAGAAVSAFMEVCPDRIDLIHRHYRSLVRKIVDMDEWNQLAILRLMTYYARMCFPRVAQTASAPGKTDTDVNDFYADSPNTEKRQQISIDSDLLLLLDSIKPLLHSRNSGVVVAVTRCYVDIGTPEYVKLAIGPLIALLRGAQDIQQLALYNIVSVCLMRPNDFVKYASHFLVRATDSAPVWELKLEVLTIIFPHSPLHVKSLILKELEHFSQGSNKTLVIAAVRAIGRCAQSDAKTAPRCLKLLLSQITSFDGVLAAESLTVIRHLIQQDAVGHVGTVVRLAKNLDSATDPQARATIIWLVGEFSGLNGEDNIAPDVLRILLKDFTSESEAAKRQILLLGAKVYLHHVNRKTEAEKDKGPEEDPTQEPGTHPIVRLWEYLLLLVRYDTSYELRDRARMYKSLLGVPQLATLILLAPKPAPQAPSPSESRKGFLLGSSSLVLAGGGGIHGLRGYETLPKWVKPGKEPDPRLRDHDDGGMYSRSGEKSDMPAGNILDRAATSKPPPSKSNGLGEGVGTKTLDDWLAEDNGEEESEETEEESEEETEEEETGDEEGDEDGDEEAEEEGEEGEEESDDDGEGDRLVKE